MSKFTEENKDNEEDDGEDIHDFLASAMDSGPPEMVEDERAPEPAGETELADPSSRPNILESSTRTEQHRRAGRTVNSRRGQKDVGSSRSHADPTDLRIGIWGAPRAGKTTFLSALRVAAQNPVMGYDWNVSGRDELSRAFLAQGVKQFVREKSFPMATRGYSTLSWKFEGTRHREPGSKWANLLKVLSGSDAREVDIEFVVEMQDVQGEVFRGSEEMSPHYEGVLTHLLHAKGIVYMFDPIGTNVEDINSFDFYFETVELLKSQMREQGLLVGGKLPHYVSVCVMKFDDPEIFNAAMDIGVIYQSDDGAIPMVPSDVAPEFLRGLCRDDGSRFVCDSIENDFVRERVKYFATSSIGFHLSNGRFDRHDFTNASGDGLFRATARPINVLEPIISLEHRIRRFAGIS